MSAIGTGRLGELSPVLDFFSAHSPRFSWCLRPDDTVIRRPIARSPNAMDLGDPYSQGIQGSCTRRPVCSKLAGKVD